MEKQFFFLMIMIKMDLCSTLIVSVFDNDNRKKIHFSISLFLIWFLGVYSSVIWILRSYFLMVWILLGNFKFNRGVFLFCWFGIIKMRIFDFLSTLYFSSSIKSLRIENIQLSIALNLYLIIWDVAHCFLWVHFYLLNKKTISS